MKRDIVKFSYSDHSNNNGVMVIMIFKMLSFRRKIVGIPHVNSYNEQIRLTNLSVMLVENNFDFIVKLAHNNHSYNEFPFPVNCLS